MCLESSTGSNRGPGYLLYLHIYEWSPSVLLSVSQVKISEYLTAATTTDVLPNNILLRTNFDFGI